MIKVINRVIYALIVAIGLMLVFNLSDSYARTLYLEEKGAEALADEDFSFFVSSRFYTEVPVVIMDIEEGEHKFKLRIYEVAYVRLIDGEYIVSDGIFVLMHQTKGDSLFDFFSIRISASDTVTNQYLGVKLFSLPLYSAINEETKSPIIKTDEFLLDNDLQMITKIEVFQEDELFTEIAVEIKLTEFNLKNDIESYILTNDKAPTEPYGTLAISPVIHIDTTALVFRNIAIYMVVTIILTVLIFKMRKRLGRKEPTTGLKQDIEKINK